MEEMIKVLCAITIICSSIFLVFAESNTNKLESELPTTISVHERLNLESYNDKFSTDLTRDGRQNQAMLEILDRLEKVEGEKQMRRGK